MPKTAAADPFHSALAELLRRAAEKSGGWFTLPGGGRLFEAGDPADSLYLVQSGRLGVFRRPEGGEPEFLGVIRPGEPAGEMSLVAGTPHTATVVALRDSEILSLPRDAFFDVARRHPEVMSELARLMILRARQTREHAVAEPTVFGFVGLSEKPIRPFVDLLEAEIAGLGVSVKVIDSRALKSASEWFSNIEETHDVVVYTAERDEVAWTHLISRQVDRLFLVGRGEDEPPHAKVWGADPLQDHRLVDLVLIWKPTVDHPSGTDRWLDALDPARWFHVRGASRSGAAKIARVLTGRSVGLVLSGGGARAFAHIGSVKALREFRTPFDFLGGASMGGIIAAALAMGWDQEELERRMRKAFVDSSPLDDVRLPLIAMTGGRKVDQRLEEHFGDTRIEDMWTPYFCVSSNLTTGAYKVHKRGLLRRALRASISLPGVMPPVIDDGHVLVDGAVMKSFPADVMRSWHLGTVVGVDVTRARGVDPRTLHNPVPWWKWFLFGDWRRGPPIVSILMRSATITTASDLAESRRATDLLVIPKPEGVEIRDWKAYDLAVSTGHQTMLEALSRLEGPVTSLRRRRLAYHPDEPIITLDDEDELPVDVPTVA